MADDIYEDNVYSANGIKMWHSKGTVGKVAEKESGEQVYARMKNVEFEQHPATFSVRGIQIPNKVNGIFRVEGDKIVLIGETKDRYHLKQPIDYIKEFDTIGKPCETLGFLGSNADKLFITWILPEIDIYGDPIELYGMVSFGFDGKYGNHLFATAVRTICKNTHAMAVADAEKTSNHGRGKNSNSAIVTTKHNSEKHLENMGYWMRYVDVESERQCGLIKALFTKFEDTKVSVDDAHDLFQNVYYKNIKEMPTFIPPELKIKKEESIQDEKEQADKNIDLAMSLFQGAGIAISKTAFGVYNTVVEQQCHHVKAKKNDGVDSILMGNRAKVMDYALVEISQYVERQ